MSDVEALRTRMEEVLTYKPASAEEGELVEKIRSLDDDYLKEKEEFDAKVLTIELEYRKKWAAILSKRTALLEDQGAKHVPQFWSRVLTNCEAIADVIEEYDEPVLQHLRNVRFEWLDDAGKTGFKLFFDFEENKYFENTAIVKTYHTEEMGKYTEDLDIMKIDCDTINWKPKMDVTVELVEKKKKQGRKGKPKTIVVEEKRPSFFRLFFRNLTPEMELSDEEDSEEEEDSDDEDFNKTEMIMQDDWETGCVLRDCLIPHAVRWYTGEAVEEEEEDDEDDEDDSEGGSDDSDEDSDDDTPKQKKGGKAKPKAGEQNKEECKQQ